MRVLHADKPKPSVLIVDNVPENLDVLISALSEHQFRIMVASDGQDALRQAVRMAPDIILLDVAMPGRDGFEVLQQLTTDSIYRNAPVIIITSLTDAVSKVRGFELGAVDYIAKPFEYRELIARIQTHLSIRNLRTQLEQSNLMLEAHVKDRTLALEQANQNLLMIIQEHKATAQALCDSEAKFQSVFEQAAIGIGIVDLSGRWLQINPTLFEIIGYNEQNLKGASAKAIMYPDDFALMQNSFQQLIKGASKRILSKTRLMHRSGDIVWIMLFATLVCDTKGDPLYFIVVMDNITDQVRGEEALRDSEEKYRRLFENDSDAVMIIDAKTLKLEDANPAAERLFGYRRSEFSGLNINAISSDDGSLWLSIAKDDPDHQKIPFQKFVKKNEEFFIGEVSIGRFKSEGRQMVICGIRDITERKALEDKLRQAYKMEAIGTLAGGIAHDFNNILYAMMGYTEISLQLAEKGSKIERNLEQILKAGNRAKGLVHQILTFSRQDQKEIKPIRIKPLIKEALKLIRASLPATIELTQDIKSEAVILADPTQIHQIIMNLCANAGHAMRENGGVMDISLADVTLTADFANKYPDIRPGPFVRLAVSDTGCGVPSHLLGRIFDPFFTTKVEGEGTGMGLAMVHGIVKSQGGAITVYSEPELGSVFNIYLPTIDDIVSAPVSKRPEAVKGNNERILFVDDEGPLADVGRQLIESLGYLVVTETSSLSAWEKFSQRPEAFDLIITDMTMPKMTGLDLARKIMEIRPDIPIILCTGFSHLINEQDLKKANIRGYIQKPILKHEIAAAIRQALSGEASGGA